MDNKDAEDAASATIELKDLNNHGAFPEIDTHDVHIVKSWGLSKYKDFGCTLPPSNNCARICTWIILVALAWSVLWSVIGQDALPGGNIFGIFMVITCAAFLGLLVKLIPYLQLPPLLGMLIAGLLLRNVPRIDFASHIDKTWSSTLRSIALVVILIRSGLGLNTDVLRRLKCTVMRLAFIPCIGEAVTAAVMAYFLLGMKWQWAFQLGFVQAAVSLAVVIPALLEFQEQHYGTNKGIPTLVMAAASFDNVLCISGFGVCVGLSFHSGNLVFNIFRAPIEVAMGIAFGVLVGFLCWWLPSNSEQGLSRSRFSILFGGAMLAVFGSKAAQFAGAGALAALIMATIAAYGWGKDGKAPIAQATALVWMFFEPLLFGLVGAEVSIDYLDKRLVGIGIGILVAGLAVRTAITYLVVAGNNLSIKERVFIAIAWLPKATVQAAIGSVSLDTARLAGLTGQYQEEYGIQILTMAVLAIIITSPIGAIGISLAGPRMLKRVPSREEVGELDQLQPLKSGGEMLEDGEAAFETNL